MAKNRETIVTLLPSETGHSISRSNNVSHRLKSASSHSTTTLRISSTVYHNSNRFLHHRDLYNCTNYNHHQSKESGDLTHNSMGSKKKNRKQSSKYLQLCFNCSATSASIYLIINC